MCTALTASARYFMCCEKIRQWRGEVIPSHAQIIDIERKMIMSDHSDFNMQGSNTFADNPFGDTPFAEIPFEPVPFEENPPVQPVQATTAQQVTTVQAEPVETANAQTVAASAADSTAGEVKATKQADTAADEAKKKAEHEAAEAKRKAEFDAKQAEKKRVFEEQLAKLNTMSDAELLNAAIERTATDTEKLTRRNLKEFVAEFIQTKCCEDPAFARLVMHPQKNMVRCFQYITRKAYEYIQDEMKANGIKLGTGAQGYGSDIPDDLCYHWAEEYFRTPGVKEDEEKEEKFTPKPYKGNTTSKTAKKPAKKAEPKPKAEPKAEPAKETPAESDQISLFGVAV